MSVWFDIFAVLALLALIGLPVLFVCLVDLEIYQDQQKKWRAPIDSDPNKPLPCDLLLRVIDNKCRELETIKQRVENLQDIIKNE